MRSGSRSRSLMALAADPGPLGQRFLGQPGGQPRCRSSSPNGVMARVRKKGSTSGVLVLSARRAGPQAKPHVTGRPEDPRAPPGRGSPQPRRSRGRQRAHIPHLHPPHTLAVSSRQAWASLRDWLSRTHRIFPDFHAIVEDGFAAGEQVAQRITAYGTHARHRSAGSVRRPAGSPGLGPTAGSPSTGARPTCCAVLGQIAIPGPGAAAGDLDNYLGARPATRLPSPAVRRAARAGDR